MTPFEFPEPTGSREEPDRAEVNHGSGKEQASGTGMIIEVHWYI